MFLIDGGVWDRDKDAVNIGFTDGPVWASDDEPAKIVLTDGPLIGLVGCLPSSKFPLELGGFAF